MKLIELIQIEKDGNCFYRLLSAYFKGNQNDHKKYRKIIYDSAKEKGKDYIPFFKTSNEELDEIILSKKFDSYIEEIQNDGFYAGKIEIAIACIIFNLNISIYKLEAANTEYYKHYTNIWKDITDVNNKFLLVLFTNNNHYTLMKYKNDIILENRILSSNDNKKIGLKDPEEIKNEKQNLSENKIYNDNKLCGINDDIKYKRW